MTHHHSFSGSFSGSFFRYMFGVLFIAGALMATSAHAQVIDEFSGQETYMRYCAACHGESGMGDGPVAGGLPITVPDLTLLQQRSGDAFQEELLRKIIDGREVVIVHGTRYMPVWGYEFWVEEGGDEEARERVDIIVDNLIEYLRSIQR
jgi:mono/diheme cytochrome c family protein